MVVKIHLIRNILILLALNDTFLVKTRTFQIFSVILFYWLKPGKFFSDVTKHMILKNIFIHSLNAWKCQLFMHNFLCQNVSIFLLYIWLIRRINIFWFKGIIKFWSESISTVWTQTSYKKYHQYSRQCSELYQLLILNSLN